MKRKPVCRPSFVHLIISLAFIQVCPLFSQNIKPICEEGKERLYSLDFAQNPDQLIISINEIIPSLKNNQCWLTYSDCLNGLSAAYYNKRDYITAKNFAKQAVLILSKESMNSPEYAAAIANLSIFHEMTGNYTKSIELQLESIKIQKEVDASDFNALALAFEGLGISYQHIGDFETASEYYTAALNHIKTEEVDDLHAKARITRQIAACQLYQKKYDSALNHLKNSSRFLDHLPSEQYYKQTIWDIYCETSKTYLESGDLASAQKYIEKAINIQDGFNFLNKYNSWMVRGDIAMKYGDLQGALLFFEKASVEAKIEFEAYEHHHAFALPIAAKADVYSKKEDYETALELYNEALGFIALEFQISSNYDNPSPSQLINKNHALKILTGKTNALLGIYSKSNQSSTLLNAALDAISIGAKLIRLIRINYEAEDSKHALFEKANPIYEKAIQISLEIFNKTGDESYLEKAMGFSESNKAVLLYESLKNSEAKKYANIPDSILLKGQEFRTEITYYENRLFEAKKKKNQVKRSEIEEYKNSIFEKRRALQEYEKLLEDNYPDYKNAKEKEVVFSVKNLRQNLTDNSTVLVEYFFGATNCYAFFISKNNIHATALPDRDTLIEKVKVLNQLISSPPINNNKYKEDYLIFKDVTHQLFSDLLKEGLDKFPRAKKLIIVPDDILNHIPFEILTIENKKIDSGFSYRSLNYILKTYNISYNYSASLNSKKSIPIQGEKIFAGFAPSFNSAKYADARTCTADELYSLHCNQGEVNNINELFHGSTFISEEATIENFKKNSDYKILHFATHACLNEEESAMNQIFFTDGSITQRELGLYEINSSLTVLSACDSGKGKLIQGEGVLSLARGFIKAGSESVLTSLWSVDDCATADIMELFYQNISDGNTKDQAITRAKIDYLEKADLNNSHPYYWSGFVHFGDSSSLFSKKKVVSLFQWGLIFSVLILILTARFFWKK